MRGNSRQWTLVSSQGAVLVYIAANPGATVKRIAEALGLTQRAAWSNVISLKRAGMLDVRTRGRRQFYSVNLDAPFLHPTITGYTLRPFLRKLLGEEAAATRPEQRLITAG